MTKIQALEQAVRELYEAKNPARSDWADWMAEHHVFVVADNATKLAERFNASGQLARAAALLHDIADTKMQRTDEGHDEASLELARELLGSHGFSGDEIKLVVDDAIRFHSCHDGETPASLEGKILATADALAHLETDFYLYSCWGWAVLDEMTFEEFKQYVLQKLERDFNDKIQFDEIKDECRPGYENLKELFSR